MPRTVIERRGKIRPGEDREAVMARIREDAEWVNQQVLALAGAKVMPYLVEQSTAATVYGPGADGVRRYTVRAVMNTERGDRLILKAGDVRP
jgi:hypothetical protein